MREKVTGYDDGGDTPNNHRGAMVTVMQSDDHGGHDDGDDAPNEHRGAPMGTMRRTNIVARRTIIVARRTRRGEAVARIDTMHVVKPGNCFAPTHVAAAAGIEAADTITSRPTLPPPPALSRRHGHMATHVAAGIDAADTAMSRRPNL